jgi:hypothetical protein
LWLLSNVYGHQPKTGQKGYTEVSEAAFRYGKWHGYSALVIWGLMMVAAMVLKGAEKSKMTHYPPSKSAKTLEHLLHIGWQIGRLAGDYMPAARRVDINM